MAAMRISLEEYLDRAARHGFHEEYVSGEMQKKDLGGNIHAAFGLLLQRLRRELD
jgi:hypothetical protein